MAQDYYKVTAPFEHDGTQYEVGKKWSKPAGWEVDTAFKDENKVDGTPFRFEVVIGEERLEDGRRVDITDGRRLVLPVEK